MSLGQKTAKSDLFNSLEAHFDSSFYAEGVWNIFCKCIPENKLLADLSDLKQKEELTSHLASALPIFRCSKLSHKFSIYMICHRKFDTGKFVYEMVNRWLVPGKHLDITLFFSSDFILFNQNYSAFEIVIRLKDALDQEIIHRNIKSFEKEICLGLSSIYHARRILEIKGFAADEKTALIQEKIASLIQRKSSWFDYDIFAQMQHFLVTCPIAFREARSYFHMSRVIAILYFFRKVLEQSCEAHPQERHSKVKLSRETLYLPLGIKKVIGLYIGINFLREHEVFEKNHIIKALQSLFPKVKVIGDSFIKNESADHKVYTYYIELYKENEEMFSGNEIKILREELPSSLQSHVEHLVHPLFMPRNEEEIMKNIVLLSGQLKYMRDLPQVIIMFDKQKEKEISFTIILARILLPQTIPIEELFQIKKSAFPVSIDRIKKTGKIRKKHPKEVTVFRMHIPSVHFHRENHSLDLFKARHEIFEELQRLVGELRDFNGGMLAKQMESFAKVKKSLEPLKQQTAFLLENFFHSLHPMEMRNIVSAVYLKEFFQFFQTFLQNTKGKVFPPVFWKDKSFGDALFLFAVTKNKAKSTQIFQKIQKEGFPRFRLMHVKMHFFGLHYLGFIYFEKNAEEQKAFHLLFSQNQE